MRSDERTISHFFTKRWNDYLEQYTESTRRIDGEKLQFVFHIFLGKTTNEIVIETDEWIRRGQGEELASIANRSRQNTSSARPVCADRAHWVSFGKCAAEPGAETTECTDSYAHSRAAKGPMVVA